MKLSGAIDKQTQDIDLHRYNLNNELRTKIETFKQEVAALKEKVQSYQSVSKNVN